MNILITAPSMENVSGITEVVRNILFYGKNNYIHFIVGSKDGTKKRLKWVLTQFYLPFLFSHKLIFSSVDLVHINTALNPLSLCRDMLLAITCRILGKKCIVHFHGGKFFSFSANIFFRFIIKIYNFYFHNFIVLSKLEKTYLIEKFGFNESKIFVLPNCVDCNVLKEYKLKKEGAFLHILFMGRIEKEKGIYELLAALKELKKSNIKFKFILCGTGTHQKNVVEYAKKLCNENFEYKGVVTGEQKWEIFASADIFILPSYYEGLPLALIESMMMGCVPIVTDVGSIPMIVRNNINGFIVDKYESALIARYIKELSENIGLYSVMQQQAQQTILSEYCCCNYINLLEKFYKQLFGNDQNVINTKK